MASAGQQKVQGAAASRGRAAGGVADEEEEESVDLEGLGYEDEGEDETNAVAVRNANKARGAVDSVRQVVAVVNRGKAARENAKREQMQRLRQNVQSTAQRGFEAARDAMRRETTAIMKASQAQFAGVQKNMAQLNQQIRAADVDNQARFRALQAQMLQAETQMATNHRQIQNWITDLDRANAARATELDTRNQARYQATIDHLNVQIAGLQAEQQRLAGEIKGEIGAGVVQIQRDIAEANRLVVASINQFHADVQASFAAGEANRQADMARIAAALLAAQNDMKAAVAAGAAASAEAARAAVAAGLDEAARRQAVAAAQAASAAAAAQQAGAAAAMAAAREEARLNEVVDIYTCIHCGGSVHSASCAANTGDKSGRRAFQITRRQLEEIQRRAVAVGVNTELYVPGAYEAPPARESYRINIARIADGAGQTYEGTLRNILLQVGVVGI